MQIVILVLMTVLFNSIQCFIIENSLKLLLSLVIDQLKINK